MRLIFFGSGAFGVPTFTALAKEHEVVAVVTQPDRPAGRKRKMTATPVGAWAEAGGAKGCDHEATRCDNEATRCDREVTRCDNEAARCDREAVPLEVPVYKQGDVNQRDFIDTLAALDADAAVVIAFGQKLGPELLERGARWFGNLHSSLLPKYRGAAPINRAMMAGESETGVCVIDVVERMDAGDIFGSRATPIDPKETAGELHDRLAMLGPEVFGEVLDALAAGRVTREKQDESQATRAAKMSRADSVIDFSLACDRVRAHIHGVTPWPGAKVKWSSGESALVLSLLKVHNDLGYRHDAVPGEVLDNAWVATGAGAIQILKVQAPGGKPMSIDAFIRGRPIRPGDRFFPAQ